MSKRKSSADYSLSTLGLLDTAPPAAFDAITRMARRLFDVPVALISLLDDANDRQFFASLQGLSEPWASRRANAVVPFLLQTRA